MSSERGEVSITSVLVACTLMVSVLATTLGLFEGFIASAGDQTRRTDTQDLARTAADRIARNLRNLASPNPFQPQAVDVAGPTNLVFQTVDPNGPNAGQNATNTQRVRYCLDGARQLHQQTQTWIAAIPPAAPASTACPGASGWTGSTVIAKGVANTVVPIFSYDSAVLTAISQIHIDLQVDTDPMRAPGPTRISTGAFLRNQNRPPRASFTATAATGGVILNGSASDDPEGDPLDYKWCTGTATTGPDCTAGNQIGTGIIFTYATSTPKQVHLRVSDPAGLSAVSPVQTVTP